jgi:hypothetical protein
MWILLIFIMSGPKVPFGAPNPPSIASSSYGGTFQHEDACKAAALLVQSLDEKIQSYCVPDRS